jgi:hypothetical protein
MTALGAGFFRLFNHRLEIAEVEIFQHPCKIACRPRFVTFRADAFDSLERVAGAGGGGRQLLAHGFLILEGVVQMKVQLFRRKVWCKQSASIVYAEAPRRDGELGRPRTQGQSKSARPLAVERPRQVQRQV